MQQNTIVCLVIIVGLAAATIYFVTKSGYCTCKRMDTMVGSPPLNLWDAASAGSAGYETLASGYEPSMWGVLERDVATRASDGLAPSRCECVARAPTKLVPLEAVGAVVPPGSVSNGIVSYPATRGYVRRGYNVAPVTTYRYGAKYGNYDPDMVVGVM